MATHASSSSSATGPSLPFNISAFVSAKLSETNYLLWESQLKPFLIGQNWWRFIDGSYPCPTPTLSPAVSDKTPENAAPPAPVPNPEYTTWYQTDQYLMSLLRATLTEPILSQVVGFSTSQAIWECLRENFSQHSLANATHIRFQLLSLTKGSKTITEYLSLAKNLADQLSAINSPVTPVDLVTYVLRGLGPDYAMLVTAITTIPPLPTFAALRARLLAYEAQQIHLTAQAPAPQPTAFFSATHPSPRSSRGPRGGRFTSPQFFQNRGLSPFNQRNLRPPQGTSGILGPPPASRPPLQCWNCRQYGHIASKCPQARPFAGMHVASSSDPNWYMDSGATNHMTHDARSFTPSTSLSPTDQVVVGNGESLPITHSGPM